MGLKNGPEITLWVSAQRLVLHATASTNVPISPSRACCFPFFSLLRTRPSQKPSPLSLKLRAKPSGERASPPPPPAMATNLECRMYEAKYPEVDMAVMIQVKNIADMGAYVSLLEYNNIEGMILFSELSRRRIRSVSSLIKVGRIEPVMVLRVDKDKGYIDLSKRRVSEEDIQACEERYNKSKLVHSIMRHVAETLNIDLEVLIAITMSSRCPTRIAFINYYYNYNKINPDGFFHSIFFFFGLKQC